MIVRTIQNRSEYKALLSKIITAEKDLRYAELSNNGSNMMRLRYKIVVLKTNLADFEQDNPEYMI